MVGNPERAIEIVAIDHVVLRVADLERSLRFYCEVLGCREERRVDSLGLVQLRAGTALIDLVPISGELGRRGGAAPGKHGRNMDHFALRIASFDIDAIMASLRDHGIEVGEPKQRYGADGTGPSVYIVDPDGNGVELKGPPVHPS
jgi:glyoxylase I family protein